MFVIEKDVNNENKTIELKRTISTRNLYSLEKPISTLKQSHTLFYRIQQNPYQINVSREAYSWEIPERYYQMNIDPVKAFLQYNTIRHYNSRVYWNKKFKIY